MHNMIDEVINFSSPLSVKIIVSFLTRTLSKNIYNKTMILGNYTKKKYKLSQNKSNIVNADIIRWAKTCPEIISVRNYKTGTRPNSIRLIYSTERIDIIMKNINLLSPKLQEKEYPIIKSIYKDSLDLCNKYLKRNKVLKQMKYNDQTLIPITENCSIKQKPYQYRYYYNGYSMQNIRKDIRMGLLNIPEEYGYFHEIDINSCFLQALNVFINLNNLDNLYMQNIMQETNKSKGDIKSIINPVLFGHKLTKNEKWILESSTFRNIQNKINTLRDLSIHMNYCPLTHGKLFSNPKMKENKIKNKRQTQILQAYEYKIKELMVKVILKNKYMIAYDLHDGIIIYTPYKRDVSKLVFDINKQLLKNLDLKLFTVGLK